MLLHRFMQTYVHSTFYQSQTSILVNFSAFKCCVYFWLCSLFFFFFSFFSSSFFFIRGCPTVCIVCKPLVSETFSQQKTLLRAGPTLADTSLSHPVVPGHWLCTLPISVALPLSHRVHDKHTHRDTHIDRDVLFTHTWWDFRVNVAKRWPHSSHPQRQLRPHCFLSFPLFPGSSGHNAGEGHRFWRRGKGSGGATAPITSHLMWNINSLLWASQARAVFSHCWDQGRFKVPGAQQQASWGHVHSETSISSSSERFFFPLAHPVWKF